MGNIIGQVTVDVKRTNEDWLPNGCLKEISDRPIDKINKMHYRKYIEILPNAVIDYMQNAGFPEQLKHLDFILVM